MSFQGHYCWQVRRVAELVVKRHATCMGAILVKRSACAWFSIVFALHWNLEALAESHDASAAELTAYQSAGRALGVQPLEFSVS
jgi:hypothetical protein